MKFPVDFNPRFHLKFLLKLEIFYVISYEISSEDKFHMKSRVKFIFFHMKLHRKFLISYEVYLKFHIEIYISCKISYEVYFWKFHAINPSGSSWYSPGFRVQMLGTAFPRRMIISYGASPALTNCMPVKVSWWRHQMETFSALLTRCVENSPVTGEFPAQRPVTRGVDVFFDLRLNKRLSKQWWGWWFETPPCPLWRHCNVFGF